MDKPTEAQNIVAINEAVPAPYDRSWLTDGQRIALALERIANHLEVEPSEDFLSSLSGMLTETPGDPGIWAESETTAGEYLGEMLPGKVDGWYEVTLPFNGWRVMFEVADGSKYGFRLWVSHGDAVEPLNWSGNG